MKRVTSRAWLSVICISGVLVAGMTVPSAFGTTTEDAGPNGLSADDDRRPGSELTVTPGGSESARISRPSDSRGPNTLKDTDVTLSSYDDEAGRAVLSRTDRDGGTGSINVRKGDVIASPPTKAAPAGALVKVTDVGPMTAGKPNPHVPGQPRGGPRRREGRREDPRFALGVEGRPEGQGSRRGTRRREELSRNTGVREGVGQRGHQEQQPALRLRHRTARPADEPDQEPGTQWAGTSRSHPRWTSPTTGTARATPTTRPHPSASAGTTRPVGA